MPNIIFQFASIILSLVASFCLADDQATAPHWPDMFPCSPDVVGMKSRTFETKQGLRIHYVERLPQAPSGVADWKLPPTLVLVHGWPDSWRSWLRVLPLLGDGRRIVAVDQIGYGDSSKPKDAAYYSMHSKAHQLKELVDGLDLGPEIHLVGHSMGSFVSWHFAAYWPSTVEMLVLIGTGPQGDTDSLKGVMEAVDKMKSVSYSFTKDFQYSTFVDVASAGPWFPPTTVHESLKVPIEVWRNGCRGILNVTAADGAALLPKISAKTVVVHGEKDELFSNEAQFQMKALLTQAESFQLVSLEKSSHSVAWEEAGAQIVASLLQTPLQPDADHATRLFTIHNPVASIERFSSSSTVLVALGCLGSLVVGAAALRLGFWRRCSPSDYVSMPIHSDY